MNIQFKKDGATKPLETKKDETYREHFPINIQQDNIATRREFLKVLGLTSGAFFTGTAGLAVAGVLQGQEKYEPKKIAELGRMKAGQSTTFAYPTADDLCLLVHLGNEQYVAYSQKCTHLACPVYYEEKHQRIECPCHEGSFNLKTGEVLGGPPPRPLPKIELKVEGTALIAIGVNLNLNRET